MKAVKDFSIEGNPVFLVQPFLNTGKAEKMHFLIHILRRYFLGQLSWFLCKKQHQIKLHKVSVWGGRVLVKSNTELTHRFCMKEFIPICKQKNKP